MTTPADVLHDLPAEAWDLISKAYVIALLADARPVDPAGELLELNGIPNGARLAALLRALAFNAFAVGQDVERGEASTGSIAGALLHPDSSELRSADRV